MSSDGERSSLPLLRYDGRSFRFPTQGIYRIERRGAWGTRIDKLKANEVDGLLPGGA